MAETLADILEDIDAVQQYCCGLKNEIDALKGQLAFEEAKTVDVEKYNSDLMMEIDSLKRFRQEEIKSIQHQYDYYSKYTAECAKFKTLEESFKLKLKAEIENRILVEEASEAEKKELLEKMRILEKGVEESEGKARMLESQVAAFNTQILEMMKKKEEEIMSTEMKFFDELHHLQSKYAEKCEASDRLAKALDASEKEVLQLKLKLEQLAGQSTKNWQTEMFKLKAMQLRKENEELKRRLADQQNAQNKTW